MVEEVLVSWFIELIEYDLVYLNYYREMVSKLDWIQ
jgi:hypothetical protein